MDTDQPREPLTPEQIRALRGSLKGKGLSAELLKDRRLDREREEAKIAYWASLKRQKPGD